jgi:hypothetical protein
MKVLMMFAAMTACAFAGAEEAPSHADAVDLQCQQAGLGFAGGGDQGFSSARKTLLEQYDKDNIVFLATTRPYKSTVQFTFDVVVGLGGPPTVMAHAILRANQNVEWFGYGIGDQIPNGPAGVFRRAAGDDTNQSRGRRTNGVEDFVIEGISLTRKGIRIAYPDADVPAAVTASNDPDVIGMYEGTTESDDPGSLLFPPEAESPLTLRDVFGQAILPQCAVQFVWDRRRFIPIGTADQIPEGGAKSFLQANGVPETMNRYKIPEGYVWRRTDKPDGDFVAQGQIGNPRGIPVTNIALSGSIDPADLVQASQIFVDVAMRVHGLGLAQPGQNT